VGEHLERRHVLVVVDLLEQLGNERHLLGKPPFGPGVPMSPRLASGIVLAALAFSRSAHANGPFGESDVDEAAPRAQPAPSTPETTASQDATSPPPAPQPPKPSPPFGVRVDGGYSPRKLLSLPVSGADMGLAFGAQPRRHTAFWGATRLFLGSTEHGLKVFSLRAGGEVEAVIDRLRIGGGLHLFAVGVGRAVRNDTIVSWGPAVNAAARVDLIQSDGFVLFARAAVDAGYELRGGSLFWGPTFGGGVDFDLGGSRSSLK
jgi:hypothetical protein